MRKEKNKRYVKLTAQQVDDERTTADGHSHNS